MLDELIIEIKNAEHAADELIAGSVIRAKEIEAEANAKAERIAADTKKTVNGIKQDIAERAAKAAEFGYEAICAEAEKTAAALECSRESIETAIKAIADRVFE